MRLPFADEEIRNVPEEWGIYCLFQERDLVYIGRTSPRSGLRSELEHALRVTMVADLEVSHFSFELSRSPKTRAAEELRSYFESFGQLPLYNRPHGMAARPGAALRR